MDFEKRSIEISIFSLIFLILLIFLGFKPLLNTLHSANLEVKIKKEALSKKQEKLDNLNLIKSDLAALKGDLEMMEKALPKTEDMPGLLVTTEALAAQSGLSVASLSPLTEERKQILPVSSISFNLSSSGNYPSLIAFLENVEKNIRPTSVSSVSLSGGGTDRPLSIKLNMVSYYQK